MSRLSVYRQIEKVRMLERFTAVEPAPGTLYLTATHLIFVDPRNKKETWVSVIRRWVKWIRR